MEDDATQEQIDEEAKQAAFYCVQWSFDEVKKEAVMTKAQINAELGALAARALELDKISESRPWNDAELAEIYAAAERDQTLRGQLPACA